MPSAPPRCCLRKEDRLRKRREYLAVQTEGRAVHGKQFLVLVARDGSGRLGITVSKKVGNAVTRNRIKRYVREFVRQARDGQRSWLPADRDVVVVAKRSAAELSGREVAGALDALRARL